MDSVHDVIVQSNLRDAKASLQYLFFFLLLSLCLGEKERKKAKERQGTTKLLGPPLSYSANRVSVLPHYATSRDPIGGNSS